MRVAISTMLPLDGSAGGVEQFVQSLVTGLGQLTDGDDHYLIVTCRRGANVLRRCVGRNQELIVRESRSIRTRLREFLGPWGEKLGTLSRDLRYRLRGSLAVTLSANDGFLDRLGVDVVHFPYQYYERTRTPALFNPHDLQHRHFPEFFSPAEVEAREAIHGPACRGSAMVVADSAFVARDVIAQYGVAAEKARVVYFGPPTALGVEPTEADMVEARSRYRLSGRFCLYPAQFWPHKNHLRLLESLAMIRQKHGCPIPLVCTGYQRAGAFREVSRQVARLGLEDQVSFPGFLKPVHLRAIYRLADFLVFPSLFEGGGFPVLEAFVEGTPVAAARATSLPEYGGDAVCWFDPTSIQDIGRALMEMWSSAELRSALRQQGASRVKRFSWETLARTYRAIYRSLAQQTLSDEDHHLLEASTRGIS